MTDSHQRSCPEERCGGSPLLNIRLSVLVIIKAGTDTAYTALQTLTSNKDTFFLIIKTVGPHGQARGASTDKPRLGAECTGH